MAGNLYRRKPSLLSDADVSLTPPAEMFDDPHRVLPKGKRPGLRIFRDWLLCCVKIAATSWELAIVKSGANCGLS
jgi:hypothetical protein